MSKKVKLVTSKTKRRGNTVINSLCSITFDENCVGEVNEDLVEALLINDSSLTLLDRELEAKLAKKEGLTNEELVEQVRALSQQILEKGNIILKLTEENQLLTETNAKLKAIANKINIVSPAPSVEGLDEVEVEPEIKPDEESIGHKGTEPQIKVNGPKSIDDLSPEAKEAALKLKEKAKLQLKKQLEGMDLPVLKNLCEENKLPKEEWESFTTKKDTINYIMSK